MCVHANALISVDRMSVLFTEVRTSTAPVTIDDQRKVEK